MASLCLDRGRCMPTSVSHATQSPHGCQVVHMVPIRVCRRDPPPARPRRAARSALHPGPRTYANAHRRHAPDDDGAGLGTRENGVRVGFPVRWRGRARNRKTHSDPIFGAPPGAATTGRATRRSRPGKSVTAPRPGGAVQCNVPIARPVRMFPAHESAARSFVGQRRSKGLPCFPGMILVRCEDNRIVSGGLVGDGEERVASGVGGARSGPMGFRSPPAGFSMRAGGRGVRTGALARSSRDAPHGGGRGASQRLGGSRSCRTAS